MTADASDVLLEGPWRHRFVAANGARFHVAECGSGPLVLLLHGFPQFWWAWRHQLEPLARAGYRAVAMDLRGYGASDKPPRGYDTPTSAADVAGVVRALGAPSAVVVGHDWGGWVAWSMPGLQPKVTSAVAVLGMGHPLTMRSSFTLGRQRRAAARLLAFQAPLAPERSFERRDGVRTVLEAWSGPGWPDDETVETYTRAMRVPFVAHSSLEYYRWAVRSLGRRDGRRFAAGISAPVAVPVLQLQGGLDPWVLPESAALSVRQVAGAWRYELLPTAGHYLAEEAPDAVTALLLDWLSGLPARHGRAPAAAPVPGRQRPGEIVPVSRPSRSGPSRPPRWR